LAARALWLVLIIATLYLCYFHNLGAIGLVGPDEPRYAWIAREMQESGDWVTPRLYGKPWFEKPPLLYWGVALSFKLFGISDVSARLPSALAALLATLALAWLAWRVYGPWTARWLLLLLPTTVGMIGFSHAIATDMLFTAALSVALVFAAIILGFTRNQDLPPVQQTPWLAPIFFGFFLGLATLAKGPAAIMLSGGGVLTWAAFTRRWRDAFRCVHPAAIVSFCLTALPWYMICARRNPDFIRIFILEHNFKRYLTPEFQHIQPFWFYGPILLIAFVPWTPALLWSAQFGVLRVWPQRRPSDATLLALSWAVFCLVFFSISRSKLPGYILPAVPPIGLLLSRAYVRLAPQCEKEFKWMHILIAIAYVQLPLLFKFVTIGTSSRFHRGLIAGTEVLLLLLGIAISLFGVRRTATRRSFALASLCVIPIFVLLLLFNHLMPLFMPWDPSAKTLAQELQALHIPPQQTYTFGMRRSLQYGLSFYLHQEIPTWDQEHPKEGYLIVSDFDDCNHLVKAPWICSNHPVLLPTKAWFVFEVLREDSVRNRDNGNALGSGRGGVLDGDGLDVGNGQPR
jgi:4-amino-4-deoxy-L-arabinose transferase-like glycosyltransferase